MRFVTSQPKSVHRAISRARGSNVTVSRHGREQRQLWPARLPAWKVAALAAARAQSEERLQAAGPLAELPSDLVCMDLLGAEAIVSLGHTCSFFAALTSGEYERVRRVLSLVRVDNHSSPCMYCFPRNVPLNLPGVLYVRMSRVPRTSCRRWRQPLNMGVPPHERHSTTDDRNVPFWRPWLRWRPVAHDTCKCVECGELVACQRMADMWMRVCRNCTGGFDRAE